MSLFRDDFYSTKVSRWKRTPDPERSRILWVAVVSGLAGMAVMFLLVLLAGGLGKSPDLDEWAIRAEDRIVEVAEAVRPAVVSVISTYQENGQSADATGMGSGVIFKIQDKKAYIATNNHVVEGADRYEVILFNGEREEAELVGADIYSDLAVLMIDARGVRTVAQFGDSDKLKPGQTAITIGNPLGMNVYQPVSVGVISWPKVTVPVYLGQSGEVEWELDVIQIDAALNRGNSGGALINLKGEVVGINSLKVAEFGVEGMGFAIPINDAKPILETLLTERKISRPFIGVTTENLRDLLGAKALLQLPDEVEEGLVVLEAVGPAAEAGLKTNDVIVKLDDTPVGSTVALRKYLYTKKKIGEELTITYYRGGKLEKVKVKLAEREP